MISIFAFSFFLLTNVSPSLQQYVATKDQPEEDVYQSIEELFEKNRGLMRGVHVLPDGRREYVSGHVRFTYSGTVRQAFCDYGTLNELFCVVIGPISAEISNGEVTEKRDFSEKFIGTCEISKENHSCKLFKLDWQ